MHLWIQSLNEIGEHFLWLEQVCPVQGFLKNKHR